MVVLSAGMDDIEQSLMRIRLKSASSGLGSEDEKTAHYLGTSNLETVRRLGELCTGIGSEMAAFRQHTADWDEVVNTTFAAEQQQRQRVENDFATRSLQLLDSLRRTLDTAIAAREQRGALRNTRITTASGHVMRFTLPRHMPTAAAAATASETEITSNESTLSAESKENRDKEEEEEEAEEEEHKSSLSSPSSSSSSSYVMSSTASTPSPPSPAGSTFCDASRACRYKLGLKLNNRAADGTKVGTSRTNPGNVRVTVTQADEGQAGFLAGIRTGDTIVSINNVTVSNVAAFRAQLDLAQEDTSRGFLLLEVVRQQPERLSIAVPAGHHP